MRNRKKAKYLPKPEAVRKRLQKLKFYSISKPGSGGFENWALAQAGSRYLEMGFRVRLDNGGSYPEVYWLRLSTKWPNEPIRVNTWKEFYAELVYLLLTGTPALDQDES